MAIQFDWDRHNIGHVTKHRVTPAEVEQVLSDEPIYIETQIDENSGEERIIEIGQTRSGRVLIVAWTPRGERTRIVTAFGADPQTRKLYIQSRFRKSDEQ